MDNNKIDDMVDEWHDGASELLLHEYLGWTFQEYKTWVESSVPPRYEDGRLKLNG